MSVLLLDLLDGSVDSISAALCVPSLGAGSFPEQRLLIKPSDSAADSSLACKQALFNLVPRVSLLATIKGREEEGERTLK